MQTVAELLVQNNELLRLIHLDLGGGAQAPSNMRSKSQRAAPGFVTVTFSWDPASDGGVTQEYVLQIIDPDGVVSGFPAFPGTDTSFVASIADDSRLFRASLTPLNALGQSGPSALASFTPHVEPPPPPLPAMPTGFQATVTA